MSERELPPIRVRILADDKDFKTTMKSVNDAIANLGKKAASAAGGSGGSGGTGGTGGAGGGSQQGAKDRWRGLQMYMAYEEKKLLQSAKNHANHAKELDIGAKRTWKKLTEYIDAHFKEEDRLQKLAVAKDREIRKDREIGANKTWKQITDQVDAHFKEQERLRKESATKEKEIRKDREIGAKRTWTNLTGFIDAHFKEQDRLQKEAATKEKEIRKDREAGAKRTWSQITGFIDAHFEQQERLQKEAAAKEKEIRKDREIGAKRVWAQLTDYIDEHFKEQEKLQKQSKKNYLKLLKFNSKLLEDQIKNEQKQQEEARKTYLKKVKFNSKLLEDQIKAEEKRRVEARKTYIRQVKFNSKLLEDQQKADEAATASAKKKYMKMVKYQSKLLEDQMKADEAATVSARKKYMKMVKYQSKLLEDQMKAEEQLRADHRKTYLKQVKYNSKLLEDLQKTEEKKRAEHRKTYLKQVKYNSKLLEDQMKADEAAIASAKRKYMKMVKYQSKLLEDQMKADAAAVAASRKAYIKKVKFNSKVLEDQQKAQEAADRKRERDEAAHNKRVFNNYLDQIRREMQELKRAEKEKLAVEKAAQRERDRVAKESARQRKVDPMRSGMGSGLTARADIYMHANAISSLVQSGKGMLDVYANFKAASAGIEVFTKDAIKANAVMGDLMQYAQQTPYSMAGIAEETKNMMGRGVAVDMAADAIKRLGIIAGGSQERLGRLSLVFSQIMTKGKLMQQDLNQLAEHGFNPLATMARASLKPGFTDAEFEQRLREITLAKEQGLVTSKHFSKALEVETSKGGYYADLLNRMSKEVGGLTSRLAEMFLEMKLSVMDVLDARLKVALKTAIMYVKMLQDWVKNNREAVARIAEFASKAFLMVVAFHALGLAVASVRWWLHSLFAVMTGIRTVLTPVIFLFRLLGYAGVVAGGLLAGSLRMITMMTVAYNSVTLFMSQSLMAAYRAMVYFTYSILGNARAIVFNTMAMLQNSAVGRFLALSYQTIKAVGLIEYFRQLAIVIMFSTYALASNALAGIRGAVSTGGAVGLLVRLMGAFRAASIFAWMAFLGPIPLIVGGIGLVVAGIFAVMNALQGAGGISGAITKIWETMQWFAQAAYGFFYNFAENAGIIAKYVYENWRSMFSDLGKILGGFFMAVPGNILIMWRMGLRLTVAFGTWLITYLPTAIKNAFSAAMTFVKDVFMRILDAGKRVWKFITTPSEWGKGTKAITNFMNTLSGDVAKTREDGFYEAAKTIITEETSKMKTGLEGVQFTSPELQLNLKVPEAQKPPEPPELAIPEAPTDAAAMFAGIQPGAVGGAQGRGRDYQVQDAISVQSGDYTKKMAEYMDRMRGMKAATSDPKLQAQNKANQILQRIEKNTQQKPMEVAELDL